MMKKWAALVCGVLFVSPCWADAGKQTEISLAAGMAVMKPDVASPLKVTDDKDSAWQLTAGTAITPDWGVQVRYADLGEARVNKVASVDYQLAAINAVYGLPVLKSSPLSFKVLAGVALVHSSSTKLTLEKGDTREAMLGLNMDYRLSDAWRVRLDQAFYGKDLSSTSVGLAWRF